MRGGDERRILPRRAVMRNLEHISPKIGTGAQNCLLPGRLDVAGEQQPDTGHADHDHQAAVVLPGRVILIRRHMIDWS
jgi:hypothetical protein